MGVCGLGLGLAEGGPAQPCPARGPSLCRASAVHGPSRVCPAAAGGFRLVRAPSGLWALPAPRPRHVPRGLVRIPVTSPPRA